MNQTKESMHREECLCRLMRLVGFVLKNYIFLPVDAHAYPKINYIFGQFQYVTDCLCAIDDLRMCSSTRYVLDEADMHRNFITIIKFVQSVPQDQNRVNFLQNLISLNQLLQHFKNAAEVETMLKYFSLTIIQVMFKMLCTLKF